ncbi:MAG: outer membrane lipid asymmetry maintenance protein MlaD [Pseudomonadota bacterium]
MSARGPRLEFAVGAFLLLALGSLLVLAIASTNGKFGFGEDTYPLKARFTNLGQLRPMAPVKIGGVAIGKVASIELDPQKLDAVVVLDIDSRYKDLPIDTSASILTGGLLGESYVGLQPGGDPQTLKSGDEIAFTSPAVDLIQMAGKYIFGGPGSDSGTKSDADASNPSSDASTTGENPTP